jgi:hypothetical protein
VLGLAEGLRFVNLAHLTTPGSPAIGLLWLAASLLCYAAAAALFLAPRWWWAVGAMAVVIAQVVIFTLWSDAKVGTIANALLLVAVLYGWASRGPQSLRAEYERDLLTSWPRPPEELGRSCSWSWGCWSSATRRCSRC